MAQGMRRTLIEPISSQLLGESISKAFWAEPFFVSVYVPNRVATCKCSAKTTPFEVMFGLKPNFSRFLVFWSCCWYSRSNKHVSKLPASGSEAIMIGYARASRCYKLWECKEPSEVVPRDVRNEVE